MSRTIGDYMVSPAAMLHTICHISSLHIHKYIYIPIAMYMSLPTANCPMVCEDHAIQHVTHTSVSLLALTPQELHHEVATFMHLEPAMPLQSPSGVQPVQQLSFLRSQPSRLCMILNEHYAAELLCSSWHGQHDITKTLRPAMYSTAACMHRVLTGNVNCFGRIGSLHCLTSGCCVCGAGRRCGTARARSEESGTAQQGRQAHHRLRWALGCREPKDCCSPCQRHAGRQGCWRAGM